MSADGKNESQDLDRYSGNHESRPGAGTQQKERRSDDHPSGRQQKKSSDSHVYSRLVHLSTDYATLAKFISPIEIFDGG
jgi:hypothetical protein